MAWIGAPFDPQAPEVLGAFEQLGLALLARLDQAAGLGNRVWESSEFLGANAG